MSQKITTKKLTSSEVKTNPQITDYAVVIDTSDGNKTKLAPLLNLPSTSAGASWGTIGGTLSDQTDLNSALGAKQDTLVSGTNIKTVNSQSILGSGNIAISGGAVDSVAGKTGDVTLVKGDVGLGNVDNTSDANKPVSTATQTALNLKANDNAVVKLTGNQTIAGEKTFSNIMSVASINSVGQTGDRIAYWDSSKYLSHLNTTTYPALTELSYVKGVTSAIQTQLNGKAATSHTHPQSDVTNLVSDLALKAPLASPALTGNPTAPTQSAGNNSTRIATTAYADAIAALKADDNAVVKLTGDQTVAGVKTFSSSPVVPTPTTDMQAATKKYVDDNAGGGGGFTPIQYFITSSQTLAIPAGAESYLITIASGAGGGGSGCAGAANTSGGGGGGGGAIHQVRGMVDNIPGSGDLSITIGAGGSAGAGVSGTSNGNSGGGGGKSFITRGTTEIARVDSAGNGGGAGSSSGNGGGGSGASSASSTKSGYAGTNGGTGNRGSGGGNTEENSTRLGNGGGGGGGVTSGSGFANGGFAYAGWASRMFFADYGNAGGQRGGTDGASGTSTLASTAPTNPALFDGLGFGGGGGASSVIGNGGAGANGHLACGGGGGGASLSGTSGAGGAGGSGFVNIIFF
jgi:hypothetical protein